MKKLLILLLLAAPLFGQQPVKDLADGPVAAGTAPSFSQLFGCVYNTSLPTPSNGQQVATQCDSTGRQIVDVANTVTVTGAGGTFPVTGTVAVTQSTSPWVISFTAPQHVILDSGTTVVTQGTAANFNATVVGSGVFEVGPTTAANTLANQFFTQLSDGTHGQTFMSTTTTSKFGADTNILSILGTAPTTAGFLDIKGADGNVFVRQTTAANFNATVVGSGVFEVGPTTSANTKSNQFFFQQSDGTNAVITDPCQGQAKVYIAINQTANTKLWTGTSAKKAYICSIDVVVASATNVALIEGTGSVCATNPVAVLGVSGGTTAATGWNLAANGGISFGSGGFSIGQEAVNADDVCLFNSGSGQVSGGVVYAVQ